MDYDEYIEAQEVFLQYAQKAIDIYDEIYDALPDKYKKQNFGNKVKSVKSMFGRNTRYKVDEDEATFDSHGIEFEEEDYRRGSREWNNIEIPSTWIIPDEAKQRELIEANIKSQCEKIEKFVSERELVEQERKKNQIKEKEKKDHEEYLRLKKKFEN